MNGDLLCNQKRRQFYTHPARCQGCEMNFIPSAPVCRRYPRALSSARAVISTDSDGSRGAGDGGGVERSRECVLCDADTRCSTQAAHAHSFVTNTPRDTAPVLQLLYSIAIG